MSQRSRQKSRNKGRQSGARGRSGVASTSVAASAAVATSDPASPGSASLAVSGSTALSQSGSAARSGELLPCDEALFDRALTQWQFGDWNRLAGLDSDEFAHHPRRARLALLAAAGHQQLGRLEETRRLVRLAHEWGCDRTLIARVLISGVYNTLGRVNALTGRQSRARERLETALVVGAPGQDFALLLPARMQQQFDRSGLPRLDQGVGYAAVPALFRCRLDLDGQTRWLAFNPASPEHYSVQDGVLSFQLPPDKPGYLVSNETGDFNLPPSVNQLPLAPDTAYEISGHIACDDCEEPPIVWLFEYADGNKLNSKSFSVRGNNFISYFRTGDKSKNYSLAIRFWGEGAVDFDSSFFRVKVGEDITVPGKKWVKQLCESEFNSQKFSRFNERPVEFAFLFKVLSIYYPKSILDVGTGLTALPHLIRNCGALVTAIDNVTDYWREDAFNRHYFIIDDDITKTRLNSKFDLISCISVLEHIKDFNQAVCSMSSLLVAGGFLVITCPYNDLNYCQNVYKLKGSSYGQNAPYVTQAFSRSEVNYWVNTYDLELIDQEYWQYWSGEYWTVDKQIIPPLKSSADKAHQLTCLLFRKRM